MDLFPICETTNPTLTICDLDSTGNTGLNHFLNGKMDQKEAILAVDYYISAKWYFVDVSLPLKWF